MAKSLISSNKVSTQLQVITMDEVETGPLISTSKRELVQDYVNKVGGKRVIQRILIANNGMAATKSILSMRNWAYMNLGDENALEFIVMATKDDLNANAEFIRLADAFVEVPSGSNKVDDRSIMLRFLLINLIDLCVADRITMLMSI
jgi:acetyl-CoA carboxylase / biotin carboxylase 1